MKNFKLLTFLIFILSNYIITSQNMFGTVIYGIERINKAIPTEFSSSKDLINLLDKGLQNIEYQLTFNNIESNYNYIEKMDIDDDLGFKLAIAVSGGDGTKYVNSKTKEVLKQMYIDGTPYLIPSNLENLNWILFNETKMIQNFLCFKAVVVVDVELKIGEVVKQNITAWYAPKIPVNFGPDGYGGLPGLILELNTPKVRTFIKSIKTSNTNTIEIIKPTKGKIVSLDEFRTINNKLILNYKNGS